MMPSLLILTLLLSFAPLSKCANSDQYLAPTSNFHPSDVQSNVNEKGPLDGMTIMRFIPGNYFNAGGVETYLQTLNQALLERNEVTIIQLFMVDSDEITQIVEKKVGRGTLFLVPIPLARKTRTSPQLDAPTKPSYALIVHLLSKLGIKDIMKQWLYKPYLFPYIKNWPFLRRFYIKKSRNALKVKQTTEQLFKRFKINIAIVHSYVYQDELEVVLSAKAQGIPVILQNHFENIDFNDPVAKQVSDLVDGIGNVNSNSILEYNEKTAMLSDGIDTDFFYPVHSPAPSSQIRILLPARIYPGKGHQDMIACAKQLKTQIPSFKIIFAGREQNSQLANQLRRAIADEGLSDYFEFTGALSPEALKAEYAKSAIVMLPSDTEGLPRVLLEAQAMQIPTIAYPVGGTPDAMIDQQTGFLVKKGDITELSKKIVDLARNPEKRRSMGIKGRNFVIEKFSIESLAKRHEQFYLEIIRRVLKTATLQTEKIILQAA